MAASTSAEQQYIFDSSKIELEKLASRKGRLETELNDIEESLKTLYECKAKYNNSKEALEIFEENLSRHEILVPLTSSMYVPGRIKEKDNFIINIGTGYLVEKNLEGSKDYFKRRIEYVQEQIEKIEQILKKKSMLLKTIGDVINNKKNTSSTTVPTESTTSKANN